MIAPNTISDSAAVRRTAAAAGNKESSRVLSAGAPTPVRQQSDPIVGACVDRSLRSFSTVCGVHMHTILGPQLIGISDLYTTGPGSCCPTAARTLQCGCISGVA